MSNIYCLGETVYDILFENNIPSHATPGGSMLNAAVTLGRLGVDVEFISEVGNDKVGQIIINFLVANGVKMNYLQKYNEGQTALAMAFLDENKNAKYEFYKSYPEKRMQQNIPEFQSGDYLLFGSFYSLTPEVRHYLSSVLEKATEAGCLIIYDPNFRKANKNKLTDVLPMLYSNLTHAHIVRGSDEDFQALFDLNSAQKVFAKLSDVLNILIYTQSSESVELISSTIYRKMNVKPIQPISTIGAGDTFNAGLCYWLYTHQKNPFNLQQMSSEECSECIETANNFAASVCMSLENYLPMEVANSYKENSLQAKTLGGATK